MVKKLSDLEKELERRERDLENVSKIEKTLSFEKIKIVPITNLDKDNKNRNFLEVEDNTKGLLQKYLPIDDVSGYGIDIPILKQLKVNKLLYEIVQRTASSSDGWPYQEPVRVYRTPLTLNKNSNWRISVKHQKIFEEETKKIEEKVKTISEKLEKFKGGRSVKTPNGGGGFVITSISPGVRREYQEEKKELTRKLETLYLGGDYLKYIDGILGEFNDYCLDKLERLKEESLPSMIRYLQREIKKREGIDEVIEFKNKLKGGKS